MKKVNFTEMKNGSKDDYLFLDKLEKEYVGETADRILNFLSRMTTTLEGYKITRLELSLIHIYAADEEDSVDLGGRRIITFEYSRNRCYLCLLYTSPSPRD